MTPSVTSSLSAASSTFCISLSLYASLTGRKLFKGKDQKEVIQLNRNCELNFQHVEKIDVCAADLLKLLLKKDPARRVSAEEALQHPFIMNA